jgi:hypothetical protein
VVVLAVFGYRDDCAVDEELARLRARATREGTLWAAARAVGTRRAAGGDANGRHGDHAHAHATLH